MPRATTCQLDDQRIDVTEALNLRDLARKLRNKPPDFRCLQCDGPVLPHKESRYGAAHFEHRKRNPSCPLSDPAR